MTPPTKKNRPRAARSTNKAVRKSTESATKAVQSWHFHSSAGQESTEAESCLEFMHRQLHACQSEHCPLSVEELEDRYVETVFPYGPNVSLHVRICAFLKENWGSEKLSRTADGRHVLRIIDRWYRAVAECGQEGGDHE
jgi:hypothetical protein